MHLKYYIFPLSNDIIGTIRKVGNRAAICDLFNVFTATVFAADENEVNNCLLFCKLCCQ